MQLFTFSQESLDEALRKFLQQFCLTGETQDRERVLLHFSKRYLECNPALRGHTYQSQDAVHTLTCAIMLLNTDLHNEALQQRRMTAEEFVENLAELNDGSNFPDILLKEVYAAIKAEPIEWVQDDSGAESELSSNISGGRPGSPPQLQQSDLASKLSFNNQEGGVNPFLSLPDPTNSVDYKRGYVMRKSCFDSNKKKTKLGELTLCSSDIDSLYNWYLCRQEILEDVLPHPQRSGPLLLQRREVDQLRLPPGGHQDPPQPGLHSW